MKRFLLPLTLIILLLSSCETKKPDTPAEARARKHFVDSVMLAVRADTTGVYLSPIKIIDSKMVDAESSALRNIRLSYKNVSEKTVIGIKFKWQALNVFGEAADMGSSIEGIGHGWTDNIIKPGEETTATWEINSIDGRIVNKAWPTEVVYEDGTKWIIPEQ